MSTQKNLRLAKAAGIYNVSTDHILEELRNANFYVEASPHFKLTQPMIEVLDEKFTSDKTIKQQAENLRIYYAIEEFKRSTDGRLILSGERLKKIPNEVLSLLDLRILDLTNNYLTDISELSEMVHLEELYIGHNNIEDLFGIESLTALVELNMESNNISDIDLLHNLTNLERLNLNDNPCYDISGLKGLVHLKRLKLNRTGIYDISALSNRELSELSATQNFIRDITTLQDLKSLKILNLRNNIIAELTPLRGLSELVELNLENNEIEDINPLKELSLKHLEIGGNEIRDINPLGSDTNSGILLLTVDKNQIEDISPLKKLDKLTTLNLSFNRIEDINPLQGLKNLVDLDISHNSVEDLSPLADNTELKRLILSSNYADSLDPLFKLEKLDVVSFDQNPICDTMPQEVIEAGWKAITFYLKELKKVDHDQRISLNEAKILLLGNTNVGKSNLLEYFETGEMPVLNDTTIGLNYKELSDDQNLCELPGDERANFHFWDFGGQEYFHATHKLFFSSGALHLVLWSKEKVLRQTQTNDKYFELKYWLRCIQQLSTEDKINSIETIIVENKIDLQGFQTTPLNQQELNNSFHEINFSYAAVSITEMRRLVGLKELIIERIKSLPTFQRKDYTTRYRQLLDLIKYLDKPIILLSELEEMDFHYEEIEGMIPVFHNMGVLLYFKEVLPDKVFAKPLILLDLLYNHILTKDAQNKQGRLKKTEIEESIELNELGLSLEDILKLLKHFDLIFQIEGNEDEYFAPQYLQETMHGYLQFFLMHNFKKAPIKIQCDNYLMNIALLKIFSRYGKSVKNDGGNYLFWKDGIVIEKENQILLVRFESEGQAIYLYNSNQGDNFHLCKEVIDFILSLSDTFISDQEVQISVHDINWHLSKHFSVYITVDGDNYVSYKKIRASYENRLYKFEENGITYTTYDFKQYFPLNALLFMKKIFLSYSAEDGHFRNELEKHLSALKRSGYVETWHCGKLIPGQKWDEAIKKQFDESDIALFLISPDFMATDYIHDVEIQRAFQRHSDPNDNFKIVPIVIRYCDWEMQMNNLKDFTALPYKARPVKSFDDHDKAWYIIVERLKWIISKENYPLSKDVIAIEEEHASNE